MNKWFQVLRIAGNTVGTPFKLVSRPCIRHDMGWRVTFVRGWHQFEMAHKWIRSFSRSAVAFESEQWVFTANRQGEKFNIPCGNTKSWKRHLSISELLFSLISLLFHCICFSLSFFPCSSWHVYLFRFRRILLFTVHYVKSEEALEGSSCSLVLTMLAFHRCLSVSPRASLADSDQGLYYRHGRLHILFVNHYIALLSC